MFLIILNCKKKLAYFLKMILAMAILIILVTQLAGAIQLAGETYRRWINRDYPHGNPIKVYKNFNETNFNTRNQY